MNKLLKILVPVAVILVGCTKEQPAASYLEVIPSEYESAIGEGDGFLLTIKSNVNWAISVTDESGENVDWIVLDAVEGSGDADIFGVVKRGSRSSDRNCLISVIPDRSDVNEVVIAFNQGIFVPVILQGSLAAVVKAGSALEIGQSAELDDFTVFKATLVLAPGTENIPDDGYGIVTDEDCSCFAKLKCPGIDTLSVGDTLKFEQTGGSVKRTSASGYEITIASDPEFIGTGTPDIHEAYIPSSAIPSYENYFVKLGPCQARDSYVGTKWSGSVGFDLIEDEGEFDSTIDEGVSFAPTMGDGSGYVHGVVTGGVLRPVSGDGIDLSAPRGKKYVPSTFSISPVVNIMHCTAANTVSNGTYSGSGTDAWAWNFSGDEGYSVEGACIEREIQTGTKLTCVAAAATLYQSCFTTINWTKGTSSYIYTVPVNQTVYGPLEFCFSVSHGTAGNLPWTYEVCWSKDKTNWNPVDRIYTLYVTSAAEAKGNTLVQTNKDYQNHRNCAEFEIPESEAISSGNLYFRVRLANANKVTTKVTLRMNVGSYLATAVSDTPIKNYDNILAMENFASIRSGINRPVGVTVGYLHTESVKNSPKSDNGFGFVGSATAGQSCIYYDLDSDIPCYVCSPALTKLNSSTDIKVTFKAALFEKKSGGFDGVEAVDVGVDGSGTVSDIVWDKPITEDPHSWHSCSCTIIGADATTIVKIGNIDGIAGGNRFYIDDIIISK